MLVVCTFAFFSCTNEDDLKMTANPQTVDIKGMLIENQGGTLAFENESQLKMALDKLSEISLTEEGVALRAKVVSADNNGFQSLHDLFRQAMDEAESYYEREGGYEEFKQKYASLYFPEEGDDYAAYLPVSDDNLAKIADTKGNVIIGGEIKNLKDVNNYNQLELLGKTPPEDKIDLRALSGTNGITEEKSKDGKRKVWVKCHRRTGNFYDASNYPVFWLEICFRRKNFVGSWYNHSGGTSITVDVPGFSAASKGTYSAKTWSSHDFIFPITTYKEGYVNYVSAFGGTILIDHNKMEKTLTLTVSYSGEVWHPARPM